MLKPRLRLVTEVVWPPLDQAQKIEQQNLMTNTYVKALRVLAPDTGAYVNEVLYFFSSPTPYSILGRLGQPFLSFL
jgi:hypothetical protein